MTLPELWLDARPGLEPGHCQTRPTLVVRYGIGQSGRNFTLAGLYPWRAPHLIGGRLARCKAMGKGPLFLLGRSIRLPLGPSGPAVQQGQTGQRQAQSKETEHPRQPGQA